VLLTSDAVKAVFKLLNNKIEQEAILVQVPHHGSIANHFPDFWSNLRKTKKCPSVFSIGDEPKDRLPNKDTVAFFDKNNFTVHATNEVYGISEYFKGASSSMQKPNRGIMNTFSKPKGGYKFTGTPSSHNGDQKFCVFK
jgi:beta-lactamase superfamily II metal-dependent hydrolase